MLQHHESHLPSNGITIQKRLFTTIVTKFNTLRPKFSSLRSKLSTLRSAKGALWPESAAPPSRTTSSASAAAPKSCLYIYTVFAISRSMHKNNAMTMSSQHLTPRAGLMVRVRQLDAARAARVQHACPSSFHFETQQRWETVEQKLPHRGF